MYLLIFGLWLIFKGRVTLEILLFGLALTAGLGLLAKLLFGYGPKKELRVWRMLPLFLVYLFVLFWEVLKANLSVMGLILRGSRALEPSLVRIRVGLKTSFARFLLANSITLTPGTLSVESRDDVLTIHCLHPSLLENTENGVFVRLLRRMEAVHDGSV